MLKMITMFADGREVGIKFAHWQVQSSCSVLKCTLPEACSEPFVGSPHMLCCSLQYKIALFFLVFDLCNDQCLL